MGQVETGQEVYSADGERLGKVIAVTDHAIVIETPEATANHQLTSAAAQAMAEAGHQEIPGAHPSRRGATPRTLEPDEHPG